MRAAPTRWLATAIALALVWSPQIGWACSVCSAGRDEQSRLAFILTTAFMTFLPLLLIGAAVWWLRNRVRRLGAAPAGERAVSRTGRAAAPARTAEA